MMDQLKFQWSHQGLLLSLLVQLMLLLQEQWKPLLELQVLTTTVRANAGDDPVAVQTVGGVTEWWEWGKLRA